MSSLQTQVDTSTLSQRNIRYPTTTFSYWFRRFIGFSHDAAKKTDSVALVELIDRVKKENNVKIVNIENNKSPTKNNNFTCSTADNVLRLVPTTQSRILSVNGETCSDNKNSNSVLLSGVLLALEIAFLDADSSTSRDGDEMTNLISVTDFNRTQTPCSSAKPLSIFGFTQNLVAMMMQHRNRILNFFT